MLDLSLADVDGTADPLVIKRAEMYFHHWV